MSPPASDELGIGVVGIGSIGRTHAATLARGVRGAFLAGVADQDNDSAIEAGSRFGVRALTYEQMLEDTAVQAVVLATPPSTHVDLVQDAAAAGRHVFCEKPLAYSVDEAQMAVEAARGASIALQVGFQRRFDPHFAAVRERIDAGALGEIKVYLDSHRDPEVASAHPGSERLIFDNLCHDLDAARWLVGEVSEVAAVGRGDLATGPTEVAIALRFANGAIGAIDGSRAVGYGYECRTEIVGSKATVRVGFADPGPVAWLQAAGVCTRRGSATFHDRFQTAYELELDAFSAAIATGADPVVTGEDGVKVARLCEATDEALRQGRWVAV